MSIKYADPQVNNKVVFYSKVDYLKGLEGYLVKDMEEYDETKSNDLISFIGNLGTVPVYIKCGKQFCDFNPTIVTALELSISYQFTVGRKDTTSQPLEIIANKNMDTVYIRYDKDDCISLSYFKYDIDLEEAELLEETLPKKISTWSTSDISIINSQHIDNPIKFIIVNYSTSELYEMTQPGEYREILTDLKIRSGFKTIVKVAIVEKYLSVIIKKLDSTFALYEYMKTNNNFVKVYDQQNIRIDNEDPDKIIYSSDMTVNYGGNKDIKDFNMRIMFTDWPNNKSNFMAFTSWDKSIIMENPKFDFNDKDFIKGEIRVNYDLEYMNGVLDTLVTSRDVYYQNSEILNERVIKLKNKIESNPKKLTVENRVYTSNELFGIPENERSPITELRLNNIRSKSFTELNTFQTDLKTTVLILSSARN